jgi:predicted transcriptional regulator of viral defense system
MADTPEKQPRSWQRFQRLFEAASTQSGHFSLAQARDAGCSAQLLQYYVRSGRVKRVERGIYRLVHFPPGEHEELVVAWLWSGQSGVVSHETALALHGLSDTLPARIHLTAPASWRERRLRVPKGVVLHFGDLDDADRTWFGSVPVTNARRTLRDCAMGGLSPELLRQAATQALRRGLVAEKELAEVDAALKPFGGLAP